MDFVLIAVNWEEEKAGLVQRGNIIVLQKLQAEIDAENVEYKLGIDRLWKESEEARPIVSDYETNTAFQIALKNWNEARNNAYNNLPEPRFKDCELFIF